jgi:hypothetical protein
MTDSSSNPNRIGSNLLNHTPSAICCSAAAEKLNEISQMLPELSPNFGDGRAGQAAAVTG